MMKFKCRSCHQEIEVPDSRAGQIETCPTCKVVVEVPRPRVIGASPTASLAEQADLIHTAGEYSRSRKPGFGIERILEFVGVLIAAIGMSCILFGILSSLIMDRTDSLVTFSAIGSGITSFIAGLALAALGSVVVELKKIRMLLEQPDRGRP